MTEAWTVPGSHSVQFYVGEQFAHHAIAEFFTQDATPHDPLILLAQARTFRAVAQLLSSGRYDLSGRAVERLVFVDADSALPEIMAGDALDPERARRFFVDVFARIGPVPADATVRLYGELVDVLYARGHHAAALEVEGLATGLFELEPRLSILCGYCIEHFGSNADMDRLGAICDAHSQVITNGSTADAPAGAQFRSGTVVRLFPRAHRGNAPASVVYVIDDDASMRRSLARLLVCSDKPVRTFDSAEAFLAERDGLASGLLVVDVQLLGMSGIELLERLRDADVAWPVIAMSGSHNEEAESEALRLGARAFLRKPFDPQALLDAIMRFLP
jgi:CheY-like chemotaxis protein